MRGELDWIVMKALEKDRNRRYETANGLAADVERYLNDEPVQACPPSARYRLKKFARRNKAAARIHRSGPADPLNSNRRHWLERAATGRPGKRRLNKK